MRVFVVDAEAALELARRDYEAGDDVELFAPTLLRSQVLATCRRRVVDGSLDAAEGLELAERACRLPRRLLGDAVLRRTAWGLTDEHGWSDTHDAEYIALTQLHGDALVADTEALRQRAGPLVHTMGVDTFLAGT